VVINQQVLLHGALLRAGLRTRDSLFQLLIKQFANLVEQVNSWDLDVLGNVDLQVSFLALKLAFFVDI
jgi:hypothetical protein